MTFKIPEDNGAKKRASYCATFGLGPDPVGHRRCPYAPFEVLNET